MTEFRQDIEYRGFTITKYKPKKSKRHRVWKVYATNNFLSNYSRLKDAKTAIDTNLKNGNWKP